MVALFAYAKSIHGTIVYGVNGVIQEAVSTQHNGFAITIIPIGCTVLDEVLNNSAYMHKSSSEECGVSVVFVESMLRQQQLKISRMITGRYP